MSRSVKGASPRASASVTSPDATREAKSTATRRPIEFQPDPPLATQLQSLSRNISRLQTKLELKDEKVECQALSRDITKITEKLSEGVRKFVDDVWHCYRLAKRKCDDLLIANAIDLMTSHLPNAESLFDELRKIQQQFMYDVVDGIKTDEEPLVPCLTILNDFVEGLSKAFQEALWGLCESCLNHNDIDGYRAIQPTLLRRIARHSNELNALHFGLIDALRGRDDDEDNSENAEVDYEEEAIASIGNLVAESIRASRKASFGLVKNFWIRDRFGSGDGEEDDSMQKRLVMLFDEELGYIDRLVKKLQIIKDQSNEEEEEEDELAEPIVPFLEQQVSIIYSDLLGQMKVMWGTAHKEGRLVETTQFGLLIVDLVNAQMQDQEEGMTLAVVAGLFELSAKYRDNETFKEFKKMLVTGISQTMEELETLRGQELHLIWEIPKNFKDDEDGNRMSEIQIETVKERIRTQYDELSQRIDNQALQITEALRQCNNAIFIYKKFNGDVLPKEGEEQEQDEAKPEEETDEFFEFAQSDVSFNEKTHEHLASLNKFLTDIYELVITNQSTESDGASTASKKSAARKAARSKSARKKINSSLEFDEKMQVEFTENSIVHTYEQLFASLRGLITVAIRNLEADSAERLNQELRTQQIGYLGHLEDLRRACVEAMDVKGTKAAEERIAADQHCTAELISKCLEDSVRDVVEKTIENYWANVQGIEDEQQVAEDMIRKNLDKRFGELERQEHMQALVLLEKQQKLELMREDQRPSAAVREAEATVKRLLNQREYEHAEKEKEKLERLREEERLERKKQVEQKYAKLRKQKMDQQVRDLNNLEQSFNNKLDRIRQERDRQLSEQRKMLASSIKASQQRLVLFASRLNSTDAKARKDIAQKFEKIVQTVLKEHDMSDLFTSTK